MEEHRRGRTSEIPRWRVHAVMRDSLRLMIHRISLAFALCITIGCAGGFGVGCGVDPSPEQSGTAPAAPPGVGTQLVHVAANRGWQETGITVAPQQKFQLRYRSGAITDKDTKIIDAAG